jgi:hypothetical protein
MSALKVLKEDHFDAWAATFGERVSAMELAPDGSGFCQNRRSHHEAFDLALNFNRDSMRETQRFKPLLLDPQAREVAIRPHFPNTEQTHRTPLKQETTAVIGTKHDNTRLPVSNSTWSKDVIYRHNFSFLRKTNWGNPLRNESQGGGGWGGVWGRAPSMTVEDWCIRNKL